MKPVRTEAAAPSVARVRTGFGVMALLRRHPAHRPGLAQAMGWFLVLTAAGLAAWTMWLALTLPVATTSFAWVDGHLDAAMGRWGWVALDCLETLGLAATGVALLRRYRAAAWIALASMPLFIADMWLDTSTADTVADLREAVVMATLGEFPTTVLLLGVACSVALLWRRRPAAASLRVPVR